MPRPPRPYRDDNYTVKDMGYKTPCHVWNGPFFSAGYGRFGSKGLAHRESYLRKFGPIPDGMSVCHKCDIRPCIREDHFFLGTQQDNMADAAAKKRMHLQQPGVRLTPPRGELQGNHKLTEVSVMEMRELRKLGRPYSQIAKLYGVSLGCAYAAIVGRNWAHLKGTENGSDSNSSQTA